MNTTAERFHPIQSREEGIWSCIEIGDASEAPAAARTSPGAAPTFPIPEWCLEHGADGVTYVTRSVGCRIVPIDYTVYERRDGVPVVVGYAQLIAYQYIGTAADTPYWAHELTVSPAIMTGLAAEGLHVAGLPTCLTSPGNCALYDYSFPVSVLETVGSEESGLAEWEWPVVAGGQGTSNTSWSLQVKLIADSEWATAEISNAAEVRCDNELGDRGPGCVIPFATPTMTWDASVFPEYASHVAAAVNSGLPGANLGASSVPLHRLTDPALRDANRNKACPQSLPRPTGKSCDEYPFASTYEGASTGGGTGRTFNWCSITTLPTGITGPTGYSACMIDEVQNSGACNLLNSQLYSPQRVLDGDAFWINFFL